MAVELPRYAPTVDGAQYAPTVEGEICGQRTVSGQTYREQYKEIFAQELSTSKPLHKPRPATANDPGAKRIPFSDVWGTLMRSPFSKDRTWVSTDVGRLLFFAFNHAVGVFAPVLFFSWRRLGVHFLLYCASGMGITYSYHRQLAHRSFKSKKWLEYLAASCGMMAMQGGPIEWVSDHRYHHLHTETALDPHSSYEGFYWSHLGWMLDAEVYESRCSDRSNVQDLQAQPFYRRCQAQYLAFVLAHYGLFYALGGLPALCWRCFATSVLYHVTWFVNSASHTWGAQAYATGDQSRNNWWVGWLAFGEGWHNNHPPRLRVLRTARAPVGKEHARCGRPAFVRPQDGGWPRRDGRAWGSLGHPPALRNWAPHLVSGIYRHGLRTHQFDVTFLFIHAFERLGLVSSVKLPTEAAKRRLALPVAGAAA